MAFSGYIFMVIGIIFAKGIGFLRDIVFASRFGTSSSSDIYFTVFSTVTLIFTGIGVALSTVIIKHLNKKELSDHTAQKEYVSFFIRRTLLALAVMTAVLYIFSDKLTLLLVGPLSAESFSLANKITKIMIPSMSFVVIAYILYGVLQNRRVFFITSVMSVPYNIMVIASLFIPNIDIIFISYITTLGWLSHILILMPDFYRQGYRFFAKSQNMRMPKLEIVWIFISNMMLQLCHMMDKSMVMADSGMASCVNYASNLFVTVSSVFVVAMSSVTFPPLTKAYEEGDIKSVNKTFKSILSVLAGIFLPFLAVCALFGTDIVSLLYERGQFSAASTSATGALFVIYSFSLLGYLAEQIFNKILFLDGKYAYTVVSTIIVVALKFILNSILIPKYGAFCAAACTSVLLFVYGIITLIKVRYAIGKYMTKDLIASILKTAFALLCALFVYFVFYLIAPNLSFLIPLCACGLTYMAVLLFTGEGKNIIKVMTKK